MRNILINILTVFFQSIQVIRKKIFKRIITRKYEVFAVLLQ